MTETLTALTTEQYMTSLWRHVWTCDVIWTCDVTHPLMSLYDENLVDNPFFQEVLRHEDFLNEIIANKLWVAHHLLAELPD